MPPDIIIRILCMYQAWSQERLDQPVRATEVVDGILKMIMDTTTKRDAVAWLMREDWSETRAGAKRFVDQVWTIRDPVRFAYRRTRVRRLLGG